MAVMTAETAQTRQLTAVRGPQHQVGEMAPGGTVPPQPRDSTAVGTSPSGQALHLSVAPCCPLQKARPVAPTPSPARAPTCVSLSAGSVTVTRTVLTVQMRASQPAAVSIRDPEERGGQHLVTVSRCRRGNQGQGEEVCPWGPLWWSVADPYLQLRAPEICQFHHSDPRKVGDNSQQPVGGAEGRVRLCPQCTTTPVMTASSCVRTASASPSISCVTTTVTAPTVLTSPPSVVSPGPWWEADPALRSQAASLTCPLQPQSTRPAAPMSSDAPTAAA